jgi:hypothetical protein
MFSAIPVSTAKPSGATVPGHNLSPASIGTASTVPNRTVRTSPSRSAIRPPVTPRQRLRAVPDGPRAIHVGHARQGLH